MSAYSKAQLDLLKEFVTLCKSQPKVLNLPELSFFKSWIESYVHISWELFFFVENLKSLYFGGARLGGKIPASSPSSAPKEEPPKAAEETKHEEPKAKAKEEPHAQPASEESEESEEEDKESDIG